MKSFLSWFTGPTPVMEQPQRLFMACGDERREGYLHVDAFASSNPDIVHAIEQTPWPFESDHFTEIVINHLSRVGREIYQQKSILGELFRVSAADATVVLNLPWIRHDSFWSDPTNVRPYCPETLQLFSSKYCQLLREQGIAHTSLFELFGIDFEVISIVQTYDPLWWRKLQTGEISRDQLRESASLSWGVVRSWTATLRVVKS
jgi:hypothetical protein